MHGPVPIPYGGNQVGQRRLLTLTLWRGGLGSQGAHVTIDGSTNVLPWGSAVLEVPADRPVMISVYQIGDATVGLATTTLMPHDPPVLEYRSPHVAHLPGELGPPGTVRARGRAFVIGLIVIPVGILLLFLFFIFLWFLLV